SLAGVSLSSTGVLSGTASEDDAEFQETGRFTNRVRLADSLTDRVTGAPRPRFATNTVVTLVRLSYFLNLWSERNTGPMFGTVCILCHGSGFTPDVSDMA